MPSVKSYYDAIAVPAFTDSEGVIRTGVVADGRVPPESLYWRGRRQRYRAVHAHKTTAEDSTDQEVIYAGHLIDQFGHFILDSLSRLWFAKQRPDLPIVWMSGEGYRRWQTDILVLVGVRSRPTFLAKPTKFRQIHVPTTGFSADSSYTPEFDAFLSQVTPSETVPGRRCWLSRSLIPRGGRVLGEEKIEVEAERLGWTIYHPQLHPVADQLAYLSSCVDIAGWSGSAFHILVFLRSVRPRLTIFARGPHLGKLFTAIAEQKGIRQTGHVLDLELVSGSRGKAVWRSLSDDRIVQILKELTAAPPPESG